jgi:formylglycine-generating enzyme required for sulfatase activity
MADIFISYAREDRDEAARLASALEEHKWSVWWDREILPGTDFADVITRELHAAGCVIVIWSTASLVSGWVRDEAQEGMKSDALVPVLIDAVEPPMGFRSKHAANLTDWDGEDDDPEFIQLTAAIAALLQGGGKPDKPLPAPKPVLRRRSRWRSRKTAWGALFTVLAGLAVTLLSVSISWKADTPRRELKPPELLRHCPDCPEMVVMAPGQFRMGASWFDREAQSDERPLVDVEITQPFAIGRHEVTFDEWQACVRDGGCKGYHPDDEQWGRARRPVIHVSWNDAHAYVDWLRQKTGMEYRLPTETEWEYVCHAGSETKYPFGDAISPAFANYHRITGSTQEVGSYPSNYWSLYDMNGNVWEWVEDVWHENHRDNPADGSARQGGPDKQNHVIRGGSWDDRPRRVRCISRNGKNTDSRSNEIGFRVALSL